MKKIYDKIIYIYLIVLLLIIQLGSIFLVYTSYETMYYTNFLIVLGIIGFVLYFIYKVTLDPKIQLQEIFISLLIVTDIISCIFAYDQRISILGFINRREGLLVLLTYYIIFLLSSKLTNEKYIKRILLFLTINVVIQVFYGFLQINGIEKIFNIPIKNSWKYAFGLVGNSNFFSSLNILLLNLWIGLYIFGDNKKAIIKLIIVEIFILGLISAGAMSGFVGLVCSLLLLIIYFIILKHNKEKIKTYIVRYIIVILLFIINIFGMSLIGNSDYLSDIEELSDQTQSALNNKVENNFGTGRIYIWKKTLHYSKEYLLTGIGIDQFYYLGIKEGKIIYDPITGNIVDKAHNEYLQILATEGIFKTIIYIALLLWIFFTAIKNICKTKKTLIIALFLSFTSYAIQAFFNISVVRVAPIFFMIMGLLLSYKTNNDLKEGEYNE